MQFISNKDIVMYFNSYIVIMLAKVFGCYYFNFVMLVSWFLSKSRFMSLLFNSQGKDLTLCHMMRCRCMHVLGPKLGYFHKKVEGKKSSSIIGQLQQQDDRPVATSVGWKRPRWRPKRWKSQGMLNGKAK